MTTHATLLARLADDADRAAWREFCDRYGDLIRGFAMRRGLQSADCDDIVQEVLVRLSRAMPEFRYDPSRGRFRGFLKTLAVHAISDRFSQKGDRRVVGQVDEPGFEPADADAIEAEWEIEWRRYHIRTALAEVDAFFSRRDVEAFMRYAIEGMPAKETAALLGMTLDQVYQAKSQVLKRVCVQIERQVAEEG